MINTDNPTIRKLLVPYLLWVSFATILNAKTLEKVEDCENLKEN
jgi:tryptophan-rich sensory protein